MVKTVKDYPGILTGFERAVTNLQKKVKKVQNNTLEGMREGAILILQDTENTYPITPKDTGNLINSRFLISSKASVLFSATYEKKSLGSEFFEGKQAHFSPENGDKEKLQGDHKVITNIIANEVSISKDPTVVGGFTAYYAPLVHEIDTSASGKKKNWKRKNSGIKFLEASIKRNARKVIDLVKRKAYR
jgi:hypothetical protein